MGNGYTLTRQWFNFSFEKKEAKCIHTALFLWIVELNNRLGWKKEFGIPSLDTMEGLSIGNKNTYLAALRELRDWGFIEIIKESKNQYQACIISICHIINDTALNTALDTALITHSTEHSNNTDNGNGSGTDTIAKLLNNKQKNHKRFKNRDGTPADDPVSGSDNADKEKEKNCAKRENGSFTRDENFENSVLKFFGFTELPHHHQHAKILNECCAAQFSLGQLDYFKEQFEDYVGYINLIGIKYKHGFYKYLGKQENRFRDGIWTSENWKLKAEGRHTGNQSAFTSTKRGATAVINGFKNVTRIKN